jgi:hypothetical protein
MEEGGDSLSEITKIMTILVYMWYILPLVVTIVMGSQAE